MNQVIDITAKLLATENLTIIKKPCRTAAFDTESRELILPVWKDMTPEIEGMLVGHEVGHALYTTLDIIDAVKDNKKLHTYLNVIEDVRVEKLMKRKYPGLRKTFTAGYKQLNDRDFFGVSEIADMSTLNLIDRINMWYKVGFSANVKFSKTEMEFVNRTERTETSKEVIQLAQEIYDYSKEQLEKNPQQQKPQLQMEDPEGDDDSYDDSEYMEFDESDSDESETPSDVDAESTDDDQGTGETSASDGSSNREMTEEELEEALESITDKALSNAIDELADTSVQYNYHTLATDYDIDFIIPVKTILDETKDVDDYPKMITRCGTEMDQSVDDAFNTFKTNANRTVSYLVKEFEMKKAATAYKRTQTSKSGSLDMSKIFAYQLNDDLFKRVTAIKRGKNHGMMFLLDWSGSMSDVIHDTLEQVITLAMFCHRAQIPFQVLAFTDHYYRNFDKDNTAYYERVKARRVDYRNKQFTLNNTVDTCNLLEFFNDKMSTREFNVMAKRLFNTFAFIHGSYNLGSTPLNQSLAFMTEYLGSFIRKNNIEKMSFITLTDGMGDSLRSSSPFYSGKIDKIKNFITDPITKITYPFKENSVEQTGTLLKIIKDRYNVNNIGFYIASKASERDINYAMYYNGVSSGLAYDYRKQIRNDGFATMKSVGRDGFFIVPAKSLKIEEGELSVTAKQSSKAIAKNFTKLMEGRQVNRLLLNQFIKIIA
jgi:hypothetical protein